jgi:predicted phosphodiesterase
MCGAIRAFGAQYGPVMKGPHVLRLSIALLLFGVAVASPRLVAQNSRLPNLPQSVKFAVIGDNGTGNAGQYDIGRQMAEARSVFRFDLVLMLGDNLYGGQNPADYVRKFELPYKALLDAGVLFQATLGNHDAPEARSYRPFNMNGERFYTFTRQNVRFVVLDTNALDAKQLAWADAALADAREPWKICYFHHPLYSNAGRHGSAIDIRVLLEPLLVRHGVDVVFSGHDHIYERIKPQKGITYFLVGSSGQLRKGDLRSSPTTAVGFDRDQAFMLVEIAESEMFFETISRTGAVVDSGVIAGRARMRETTNGTP